MTQSLSPAQQAQLDNRDDSGRWQAKQHGEAEDSADVLGLGTPDDSDEESTVLSYVEDTAYYPGEEVKAGWAIDPGGEEWSTIIEAADGQFEVYAIRDFDGKTGDVQPADSYSDAEEALEALEKDIASGRHYRKSFGAKRLNFDAQTSEEVKEFHRSGGIGNFSQEAGDFMDDIASRVVEAEPRSKVSSASIAEAMSEDFDTDITSADVQPVLTSLRNEGQLLATQWTSVDGEYIKATKPRPRPVGESISADQLRRTLSTGHKVDVDVWQNSSGKDLTTPQGDRAVLDGSNAHGDLTLVAGEKDLEDNYGDYAVPAGAEDAQITESKDGRITIDVPEKLTETGHISPGARYTLRKADVQDHWSGTRPIVDDQGRESPFDVGPRHYGPHPDFRADAEHVTLLQDIHSPSGEKLGTIYEDGDQWTVEHDPDIDEAPRFDDPQQAAEWVHFSSGARGTWAKPTAENLPLPGV